MSAPAPETDLLDLKLLPSWVKESPEARDYSNFEGEDADAPPRRGPRPHDRPRRNDRPSGPPRSGGREQKNRRPDQRGPRLPERPREERPPLVAPPAVAVRFLPHAASLDNVIAQIKSGSVAYSVFALARLFLEKPERYSVRLTTEAGKPLFQLGEHGPVSSDRRLLENIAFPSVKEDFYKIEIVQSEPIKGNFTNVARDRASGTLLGPTNHHSYQAQLRNLYEQRYSRRMSFPDYQRQIEIVSDPAAVEQWKEQARNITTYTTMAEPPVTFSNTAEAERHFRQHYLAGLIQTPPEPVIGGVPSRRLPDRALGRVIEDAWSHETRSPSNMMQELAGALRQAGLNIFRHRRGMLFVSPVRLRSFKHELASVSPSVAGILETITATPGIHRKELAGRLIPAAAENGDADRSKLTLAADLKWLISEGYVIEFNDGSIDLPRAKQPETKAAAPNESAAATEAPVETVAAGDASAPNEKLNGEPVSADVATVPATADPEPAPALETSAATLPE